MSGGGKALDTPVCAHDSSAVVVCSKSLDPPVMAKGYSRFRILNGWGVSMMTSLLDVPDIGVLY